MTLNLSTKYFGLHLKNPLVASASPLTGNLETLQLLEEAGAAAVVLPSLFEETIEHEEAEVARLYDYQAESSAESLSYFPEMQKYNTSCDSYLLHLRQAKESLKIPVIASLNGVTSGGWTRYAKHIEDAGADAIELNIYFVSTDVHMSPEEIERRYFEMVSTVRDSISIPLAVKIGPFFTNLGHTARQLIEAGADGLVLFNRYLEPDIDLDELKFKPTLKLSTSDELRLPLRWIAIVRNQISASIAATSGVHNESDAIKALLAGADVVMMASALIRNGPNYTGTVLEGIKRWMLERQYDSIEQLKGCMNQDNCDDPNAIERANYTKALVAFTDTL